MKEYLVVFAQLLCVGWLIKTMAKARGKLDEEQLGWFDIREGSKPPKQARPPKSGGMPPGVGAQQGKGRGPHA